MCPRLTTVVQFSSVHDGIYALGRKGHMRSTPSLRSFPSVALETVPMFVWSTMALSRPFKEDRQVLLPQCDTVRRRKKINQYKPFQCKDVALILKGDGAKDTCLLAWRRSKCANNYFPRQLPVVFLSIFIDTVWLRIILSSSGCFYHMLVRSLPKKRRKGWLVTYLFGLGQAVTDINFWAQNRQHSRSCFRDFQTSI